MTPEVKELLDLLDYKNSNQKITYNHNFYSKKIFPFFTRKPERATFKSGFKGVIGAMSRLSIEKDASSEFSLNGAQEELNTKILCNDGVSVENFTELLLDEDVLNNLQNPYLMLYYPLADGDESKGEIEVATLLSWFFDLSNHQPWQNFVMNKNYSNLVEEMIIDSLPELNPKKRKSRFFVGMNVEYYRTIGQGDLNVLLNHPDFFMKNNELFFAYYYFFYVSQLVLNINRNSASNGPIPMFYALDSEKISRTRESVNKGFNLLNEERKSLLARNDVLDYLNVLLGNKDTYFFLGDFNKLSIWEKDKLEINLREFNDFYRTINGKSEKAYDFNDNNKLLFNWLKEDLLEETASRFSRSIDMIADYHFVRSRGRLGKVLNLKEDLLILFTAIIVEDEKKLVNIVFDEFEKRGMFFDRITREEIVKLYSRMNILDKKSDSGDAQYVKPIL